MGTGVYLFYTLKMFSCRWRTNLTINIHRVLYVQNTHMIYQNDQNQYMQYLFTLGMNPMSRLSKNGENPRWPSADIFKKQYFKLIIR